MVRKNEEEITYVDYLPDYEVVIIYGFDNENKLVEKGRKLFFKPGEVLPINPKRSFLVDGRRDLKPAKNLVVNNVMTLIDDVNIVRCNTYEDFFDKLLSYVKSRIVFREEAEYYLYTSFIVSSWLWDRFDVVSYIHFLGEKGCGKTRALEVINELGYRTLSAASISTAALARCIQNYHALILIDEFKPSSEELSEILGILNAGYRRGQKYIRASKNSTTVETFDVFAPKAFAGNIWAGYTFEDRTLRINMYKHKVKDPGEQKTLRMLFLDHLTRLRINHFDINLNELFIKVKNELIECGFDSRAAEVYAYFLFFIPKKYVKTTFDYLVKKYTEKEVELGVKEEAELVKLILDEDQKMNTQQLIREIKLEDLVEKYMNVFFINERERHSYFIRISNMLRKLGFGIRRKEDGRFVTYVPDLLTKLKEMYLKEEKEIKINYSQNLENLVFENYFVGFLLDSEKEQIQKSQ